MSDLAHENLSSIIDRHKVAICLLLVALILLGVISTNLFTVLAFILFALIVLFAKEQFIICLLLFMLPFASLFKLTPTTFSLFTICEIVVIVRFFFAKKFSVSVVMAALMYLGYLVLGTFIRGQEFDANHIKQFENILILYSLVTISKGTPFEKIATYYILGMILSSFVGLYAQGNATFLEYAKNINEEAGEYTRFCGLMGDPNYYSVNMMLAFIMLLCLRKKGKVSLDIFWILYGLLTVFGFLTISKSFMLVYIVIFAVTAVIVLKNGNPIENCLLMIGVIAIFMVGFSEDGLISKVLERITSANNVNELTTGRSDIWENYMNLINSDPSIVVFGTGLTNHMLNKKGSHNLFIEVIYYLGLMGVVLLVLGMYFCLRKSEQKRKKIMLNWLGIVVLPVMYFFLQALFSYVFTYNIFICWLVYNIDFNKKE